MNSRPSGRGLAPRPTSITKPSMTATASPVRSRPLAGRPERRAARRAAERRAAADLMADVTALVEAGLIEVSIDDGGEMRYRLADAE